jgi:lipid-binding SYLF domain-containing protein
MIRSLLVATLCLFIIVTVGCHHRVGGWDPEQLTQAEETVSMFKQKDPGMKKFFENAWGYAVFPTVAKGAMGVGGAHGKGIVFEKNEAIGRTTVTQATIGFQLGGQAYSEIVFFQNREAIDRFKAGKFEIAAQASAVAVTVGASADFAYSGGVAVVTMVKGGLMYEASVGGQKFSYDPLKE